MTTQINPHVDQYPHLTNAELYRMLNEPVRSKPRSVRRLRSFFINPISCFVWLAFIPFGCLWFAYGIVQFSNAVLDWVFA